MKILHILKQAPDASTNQIIELHALSNEVKVIELYQGVVGFDALVAAVFSHDKVFCW
jgi:hypothetical protein